MALSTDTYEVANDLLQFGEDAVAEWVLSCTDEDFVRVCAAAELVWSWGPKMMLAKACAIGAVYVHDGAPRKLARERRDTKRTLPARPKDGNRSTDYWLQHSFDQYHGVGEDFVDFWAESPAETREHLTKARANPFFKQTRPPAVAELLDIVGDSITGIRTLAYRTDKGKLRPDDNGTLELTLASGRIVRLRGDGRDHIQLFFDAWRDPIEYVETTLGKPVAERIEGWVAFELSDNSDWTVVTRAPIASVDLIEDAPGRFVGADIAVDGHIIAVRAGGGTFVVSLGERNADEWVLR